jgi:hypothetical protein
MKPMVKSAMESLMESAAESTMESAVKPAPHSTVAHMLGQCRCRGGRQDREQS